MGERTSERVPRTRVSHMRACVWLVAPAAAPAPLSLLTPRLHTHPNIEYKVDWKLPSLQSPPLDALAPLTVAVGDTIVFEWKGGLAYMLYRVSKRECLCFGKGVVQEITQTKIKPKRAHPLPLPPITPAVCLESEAAFEKEKGLVLKEYNHAKTSGKLTWKADKAGEFYFVDPDRCGKGMMLTVTVEEGAKSVASAAAPAAARRLLSV